MTAVDHGEPQRSATAQVVLQITDRNDEPPIFNQTTYVFGLFEDQVAGTEVGRVKTTDADDYYDSVSYNLGKAAMFAIDSDTGIITTKKRLDRESQSSYTFKVWAHNPGPPTLSSSATVTVYVADINDNAPGIKFPRPDNRTVQIPGFCPRGLPLTAIVAEDSDTGVNAKLHYEIAKGNEEGIFMVDSKRGIISVSDAIDGITLTRAEYDLLISVTDHGERPQTAVADLVLVVNHSLIFTDTGASKRLSPLLGTNSTLAVIVGAIAFVLIILLITAIICVKRRQARRNADEYKHMCRVEALPRVSADGPGRADVERVSVREAKNGSKPSKAHCVDKRDSDYSNGTRHGWNTSLRSSQVCFLFLTTFNPKNV